MEFWCIRVHLFLNVGGSAHGYMPFPLVLCSYICIHAFVWFMCDEECNLDIKFTHWIFTRISPSFVRLSLPIAIRRLPFAIWRKGWRRKSLKLSKNSHHFCHSLHTKHSDSHHILISCLLVETSNLLKHFDSLNSSTTSKTWEADTKLDQESLRLRIFATRRLKSLVILGLICDEPSRKSLAAFRGFQLNSTFIFSTRTVSPFYRDRPASPPSTTSQRRYW